MVMQNLVSKKMRRVALAASLPLVLLSGCEKYEISILKSEYFLPFTLKTTKDRIVNVGVIQADPMLGDKNLCAANDELNAVQKELKINIVRRLEDIEDRLSNGGARVLFKGEENTLKETPDCEEFSELTTSIDKLLGGRVVPAVPKPGPIIPSGNRISNIKMKNSKTLELRLSSGEVVELGTGDVFEDSYSFPYEGYINPSQTKQGVGVEFKRTANNTSESESTYDDSCTFTIAQRICVDNVCKDVTISETGTRTNKVSYTYYNYDYDLTLQNSQRDILASLDLKVSKTESYTNFGTCRRL
jgi:hypothetical protein